MVDIVTRAGKGSPLTNNEVDANFTNLAEVSGITGEPMGHEDRTTSTISFNASTRTFTIAPVSTSFTVWCKGKKVVVSSAQTVTIPNTSGMYSIYFDANGALAAKAGYFTFSEEAPTAYIYWNAATGACPYFGDERHGVVLDWQTHEYLHRTRGAALASGFGASGYTLGGNGSSNAHAQLTLEGGTFFDEDMKIIVTATNTPTAGTWEQDLLSPARIPVLYLSGTGWVIDAPTDYPLKQGTARPQYNALSGGVWSTADVANNKYATSWILATNNLTYPVIAIIGQAESDLQSAAEAVDFTSLQLPGFPSVEFRPLYRLVFQCADSFSNAVKASLVSITDIRSIAAAGVAASLITDHGNLSGLSDDDHPQYLSVDTVRGTLTAAVKASFLPSQAGNAGKFLTTDATSTSWAALTSGNITTALGFTPYNATNPAGYITGITSSDVTTALGFTPYNATNPSGFVTAAGARGAISVTGAGSYDSATGVINIVGGVTSFNTRTGAITLSSADVTTALGFTPYNSTNPNGYLTGITSTQVTTALGYTPYNSSNPSGYITGITSGMVTTALGFTPYNNSNPSGYITSSALSGYLTSASAASTYLPLSGGTLTGVTLVKRNLGTNDYTNTGQHNLHLRLQRSSDLKTLELGVLDNGTGVIQANEAGVGYQTLALNPVSGSVTANGSIVLHAGNYNSYAPTLTGSGASGTWGINITGSAGSAPGYLPLSGGTMTGNLSFAQNANISFGSSTNEAGPWTISVIGSGGATPATKGTGYGRNLIVKAGNSDNGGGLAGGDLYLRAGAPTAPATSYGVVYLSDDGGFTQAGGSLRAPIFYDSNNTGYYVDPNGTSNLNAVNFNGVLAWADGTYALGSPSYGFRFNDTASSINAFIIANSGDTTAWTSSRAPIFYDRTNTGYYLDPNGNSVLTTAIFYVNGSSDITLTSAGTNASMIKAGSGDELYIGGNNTWQMRFSGANVLMDNGGYLLNGESIRSPIFYDSDDTSYYTSPNGNSRLYSLGLGGATPDTRLSIAGDSHFAGILHLGGTAGSVGSWGSRDYTTSGNRYFNANSYNFDNYGYGSNWTFTLSGGTGQASSSLRAPIFYDSNDTSFYVDPASRSRQSSIDFGSTGYYIHAGDWGMRNTTPSGWIQFGPANTSHAHIYTDRSNFYFNAQIQVNGGSNINTSDIKANIFYDNEDTSYYFDGASVSRLNVAMFIGPIRRNSSVAGWFEGTYNNVGDNSMKSNPIYTIGSSYNPSDTTLSNMYGIGYAHPNFWGSSRGSGWGMYTAVAGSFTGVFGAHGGFNTWIDGYGVSTSSWRAPIFYDSDNTGFYVDPTSTSNLSSLRITSATGLQIVAPNGAYQRVDTRDDSSASRAHWYGVLADGNTSNFRHAWYDGSAYFDITASSGQIAFNRVGGGGYVSSNESFRAPIFYDLNDTGYYTDPNGTSRMGDIYTNRIGVGQGVNASWPLIVSGNAYLNAGGYGQAEGSWRAPIFYDSADTGYYVNPNGSSYLYGMVLSGNMYFRPSSWIQMDGSYGIYWPTLYGTHLYPNASSTYTQLQIDGSKNSYSGMYLSHSSVNGMMYDSAGNGGVYREALGRWYFYHHVGNNCMGVGTSSTNSAYGILVTKGGYFDGRVDATIHYDASDTGYYLDPNSTTALRTVGSWRADSASWDGEFSGKIQYHSTNWYFQYAGSMLFRNSGGSNVFTVDQSGNAVASGNVTAYSDARLKENVVTIDSALDKVLKLRGVYYNKIGNPERRVGVIAQEVKPVLPEVVRLISDTNPTTGETTELLAVDYGNIAGLLIEAIKEQDTELVDLRNRVAQLESLINKLIGD
jgi:hypothetical protein